MLGLGLFDQYEFLLGFENDDSLNQLGNKGVLISSIGIDHNVQIITKNIAFETIEELHHMYGDVQKKNGVTP